LYKCNFYYTTKSLWSARWQATALLRESALSTGQPLDASSASVQLTVLARFGNPQTKLFAQRYR